MQFFLGYTKPKKLPEMEYKIATRRIRRILDHLSGCEGLASSNSHLSSMNCSSSLNSIAGRYDDRTGFAPQDSVKEEEPLFSRKAGENFSFPDLRDVHYLSERDSTSTSAEVLKFAATSQKIGEKLVCNRTSHTSISDVDTGLVWSPRIDVAESSSSYIVIVELPGVNINGIRVEVDDHKLTITGKRVLQQQWRVINSSTDSYLAYHRKEILQGPYEINLPLPKDVNKDHISAEFVDGFLQVVVPKIL